MLIDSSSSAAEAENRSPTRQVAERQQPLRIITGGALELKFVANCELYERLAAWATSHMTADPHGLAACGDRYRVRSIYLDTPDFATFRRVGGLRYRKYRLRQYNDEPLIWFERKAKVHGRVTKRRTSAPPAQAECLGQTTPPMDWNGFWYWKRVRARRLQPIAAISYERLARFASTPDGPVRLTLDRDVRGAAYNCWQMPTVALPALEPLVNACILELKFERTIPQLFKELLTEFSLANRQMSKFRTCLSACRIVPDIAANAFLGEGGESS